jgi:RNA polymerase sigma-70 factor (ECF subfamily)
VATPDSSGRLNRGGTTPGPVGDGGPDDARDLALVRRIADKDRRALEQLYTLYHRRLARFLTRFTLQYDCIGEVINDTFWSVWQSASQFRGASRVSTWVMAIAYRRALKALRDRRGGLAHAEGEHGLDRLAAADAIEVAEQRELLDLALSSLPIEQRVALELTHYLGHSCEEIAAIMDCPVNTVKTRMFHARRKLRQILPPLAGDA